MNREELREKMFGSGKRPGWGLVLGSGFDAWLGMLSPGERVPFEEIEGLLPASVPGHGGYFTSGAVGEMPVAIIAGRLHLYEGLTAAQVVEPVRVLLSMGASSLLLTTGVGSVARDLETGKGVVITDQINLTGEDPHTGAGRFPDTAGLYDPGYVKFLGNRGLRKGVLAGVRGPSYETPAEVKALESMGADIVCMSTVLEALALSGTGTRCAGVAVVANRAGEPGTSHEEVLEVVRRSAGQLWPAVSALIASGPD